GERDGVFGAVEGGYALLDFVDRRVAVATVLFPLGILVFPAHVALEVGRVVERKRCRLRDARRERVVGAPFRNAGVNGIGRRRRFFLFRHGRAPARTRSARRVAASAIGTSSTFFGFFSVRGFSSTAAFASALAPTVTRKGMPMRSASLNLTPGLSSRSSMSAS